MNKLVWLLLALPVFAQDPRQIIIEVQKRQHSDSQRYEGTLEVLSQGNQVATKRWVYQRIGSFGTSKAILRFTAPAEVKGVGDEGLGGADDHPAPLRIEVDDV